ncbi:MAG: hypothetical protein J3R72DRAFT_456440 [Linnemannia gamsii]|nr:MAG: hypothetical protein J3R72DRAFT_456440 [Linnemannia gamsii]
MHPTHRERLSQVSAESGLDFITHLNDPNLAQPSISVSQAAKQPSIQQQSHPNLPLPPASAVASTTTHKSHHHDPYARSSPTTTGTTGITSFDLDGIDPILLRHGLLQPGDMIDFHGPTGSGKTHFLYAIIISTILPKFWRYSKSKQAATAAGAGVIPLSGKARSVMFFDLDQGFSVERLKTLLCLQIVDRVRLYLESSSINDNNSNTANSNNSNNKDTQITATSTSIPSTTTTEIDITSPAFLAKIDQLALSCLRNVHIFRPADTASLLVLLRTLDSFLLRHQQQASPPFTFLILDSISSFYWQDKTQTNHTRVMALVHDALQRLVAPWGLIFLTTSWSLPSASSTLSTSTSLMDPSDRTLPDSFRAKLRYRFLLQPRNLDRFESESILCREWFHRLQETVTKSEQQQGGQNKSSEVNKQLIAAAACGGGGAEDDRESRFEPRPSLFQGQMIIPETQTQQQQQHDPHSSNAYAIQPELFRFSLSMKDGIFSFCPPLQVPASHPQNL